MQTIHVEGQTMLRGMLDRCPYCEALCAIFGFKPSSRHEIILRPLIPDGKDRRLKASGGVTGRNNSSALTPEAFKNDPSTDTAAKFVLPTSLAEVLLVEV